MRRVTEVAPLNASQQEESAQQVSRLSLPEKRVALNFKVPEHVRERVADLVVLYGLMAEASGKDPKDVDTTHVCNDLIEFGIEEAWKQIGERAGLPGMPANNDEWEALKKALVKATREDAKTRR